MKTMLALALVCLTMVSAVAVTSNDVAATDPVLDAEEEPAATITMTFKVHDPTLVAEDVEFKHVQTGTEKTIEDWTAGMDIASAIPLGFKAKAFAFDPAVQLTEDKTILVELEPLFREMWIVDGKVFGAEPTAEQMGDAPLHKSWDGFTTEPVEKFDAGEQVVIHNAKVKDIIHTVTFYDCTGRQVYETTVVDGNLAGIPYPDLFEWTFDFTKPITEDTKIYATETVLVPEQDDTNLFLTALAIASIVIAILAYLVIKGEMAKGKR